MDNKEFVEKKEKIKKREYAKPEFKVIEVATPIFFAATCFVAGTRVTMADGSAKRIEDVVEGDMIRTFNHESGLFSSARVCLAYEGERKERALQLTFESGRSLSIVGTHDILAEDMRKYVKINVENVEEYVGKRFYNAELKVWDTLTGYHEGNEMVEFYCIYSENHLNCIAEGMLTVPDDVDYILNIYELDANLKADADQLAADVAKYGLLDIELDYPEYLQYRKLMEALQCKYQKIAVGKGLMTEEDFDYVRRYWNTSSSVA